MTFSSTIEWGFTRTGRDTFVPLGKKIPLPEVKEEVYVYTIILSSRYE
jgi:hypothetical protein